MSYMTHDDHGLNLELINMARHNWMGLRKQAFIPGGDAAASAGDPSAGMVPPGGGAPPGGGGGAPPGGGGPPPGGGGGGGPPPGMALPGGGGDPLSSVIQRLSALESGGGGGAGGGAGAAGAGIKPKIDENVVLLQILKLLARVVDAMGIQVPASEMVPIQSELQGLAAASQTGAPLPVMDPTAQAGGGGGAGGGAISPIEGIQPSGAPGQGGPPGQGGQKAARYREAGAPYGTSEGYTAMGKKAEALLSIRRAFRGAA